MNTWNLYKIDLRSELHLIFHFYLICLIVTGFFIFLYVLHWNVRKLKRIISVEATRRHVLV